MTSQTCLLAVLSNGSHVRLHSCEFFFEQGQLVLYRLLADVTQCIRFVTLQLDRLFSVYLVQRQLLHLQQQQQHMVKHNFSAASVQKQQFSWLSLADQFDVVSGFLFVFLDNRLEFFELVSDVNAALVDFLFLLLQLATSFSKRLTLCLQLGILFLQKYFTCTLT